MIHQAVYQVFHQALEKTVLAHPRIRSSWYGPVESERPTSLQQPMVNVEVARLCRLYTQPPSLTVMAKMASFPMKEFARFRTELFLDLKLFGLVRGRPTLALENATFFELERMVECGISDGMLMVCRAELSLGERSRPLG